MEFVGKEPVELFAKTYRDAESRAVAGIDVVALATATRAAQPSVRMVLFKGLENDKFSFYTNYESRKGRELAENPNAALAFHWPALELQVRVEGSVERVSASDSEAYWKTRPRESQLSALASAQSRPIASYSVLVAKVDELRERYRDQDVPRPEQWGGYRLTPRVIEFWLSRPNRLHERYRYTRKNSKWELELLSP